MYTSGLTVNNVNIINKWLKGYKCQPYTQVAKRLNMSKLYKIGLKVKNVNIIHKWLKC